MKKLIALLTLAALLLGMPVSALAAESGEDLVTDAFTYDFSDEWGSYGFHVPKIDREEAGIQAVNDAIWTNLYEHVLYGEYGAMTAVEEGWSPEPYDIDYSWNVNGDVLSLWTVANYSGDVGAYNVYNVSLSAGRRITDEELLDVLGVDQETFYQQAAQVLADTFESYNTYGPDDEFKAEQRAKNNADANVRAVRPYLDEDGDLSVIGTVYALAGAGRFDQPLKVMTRDQLPVQTVSSAYLPQTLTAEQRLGLFIDRCDSEYFSGADIDGFDAQMCLYARNSVFARLGWIFASPELEEYFSQFPWYAPTLDPSQFYEDMLTDCQRANVALVQAYEAEHGY